MEPIPERLAICIFLRHKQRKMVLIALSDFAAASTFVGRVPSYDIPAKSYNPSISVYSRSRFYRDMTPKISRYIAAALHTHIDTHTHTHPHPHTHTHTHTRTHTHYCDGMHVYNVNTQAVQLSNQQYCTQFITKNSACVFKLFLVTASVTYHPPSVAANYLAARDNASAFLL